MSRLFTVGCSHTRYFWPTWADILGRNFDQFENWGQSGIGNRAIFERTIEMLNTSKPTPDDLVMIQWSDPNRFDAHKIDERLPARWAGAGNIANWPAHLIETVYCEFSYVYHTINFIVACKNVLENKNLRFIFLSANDLNSNIEKHPELEIYKEELKNIQWMPPLFDWFQQEGLPRKEFTKKEFIYLKTLKDEHPTPYAHYLYLEKFLPKEITIGLDKEWAKIADEIVFKSKEDKELFDNLKKDLGWFENNKIARGL